MSSFVRVMKSDVNAWLSRFVLPSTLSIHRTGYKRNITSTLSDSSDNIEDITSILFRFTIQTSGCSGTITSLQSSIVGSSQPILEDSVNSNDIFYLLFPQCPHQCNIQDSNNLLPINFMLQDFGFPHEQTSLSLTTSRQLYYGCSVMIFDRLNEKQATEHSDDRFVHSNVTKAMTSINILTDNFVVNTALSKASSLRSLASKAVFRYLGMESSRSPVEIELDEYSRNFVDLDQDFSENDISKLPCFNMAGARDGQHTICANSNIYSKLSGVGICVVTPRPAMTSLRNAIQSIADNLEFDQSQLKQLLPDCATFNKQTTKEEFGFAFLAESCSPVLLITTVFAILMECRIVLVSMVPQMSAHVTLTQWLAEALAPFVLKHIIAPVISFEVAEQLITCPAPFLIGISVDTLQLLSATIASADVVVINLSDQSIGWPSNNDKQELTLLHQISKLLKIGNNIYDRINEQFTPVTSALRQTLTLSKHVETFSLQVDGDTTFPVEMIVLPSKRNCSGVLSVVNDIVREVLHGVTYCTIRCSTAVDDEQPCLFNEQLFLKLKQVQASRNLNCLFLGEDFACVRDVFIFVLLRTQMFSNFISHL
jgi:hypothetical protein